MMVLLFVVVRNFYVIQSLREKREDTSKDRLNEQVPFHVSWLTYKKKIDKSIDFLRGWEEKMVEVSLGPNGARIEIYT